MGGHWVVYVGTPGAVLLSSLAGSAGTVLAFVWGFIVIPHGAAYLWRKLRADLGDSDENTTLDYRRTTSWRSVIR